MGERRRYRRLKMRLPLSFTLRKTEEVDASLTDDVPDEQMVVRGETYDVSTEGLTIDAFLSPVDVDYLLPAMTGTQKGPKFDVRVDLEGQTLCLAGAVIWYNLFFPGTPPPNFKAGLFLIEPDSNPSKQKWNEFLEEIKV